MANWKNRQTNYPSQGYYPQPQNHYNRPQVYAPQYQPAPTPPKKSGATYTAIRKGNFVGATMVNAWNVSRSKGLITASVGPYKKSDELVTSEKGHEYMKMIAVVQFRKTGNEKIIPCLMNMKTKVIVLRELGMVITPNGSGHTSSGKKVSGYFGTMTKK